MERFLPKWKTCRNNFKIRKKNSKKKIKLLNWKNQSSKNMRNKCLLRRKTWKRKKMKSKTNFKVKSRHYRNKRKRWRKDMMPIAFQEFLKLHKILMIRKIMLWHHKLLIKGLLLFQIWLKSTKIRKKIRILPNKMQLNLKPSLKLKQRSQQSPWIKR